MIVSAEISGVRSVPILSLRDLSPISRVPEDHLLVVFKSYFDSAPNSGGARSITIASACGTSEQWSAFETGWGYVLNRHGAQYLHTTDAVSLQDEFSVDKGWRKESVDRLISDCVAVIAGHIEVPGRVGELPLRRGLHVVTLRILIDDFVRAQKENPDFPESVTEFCATESLGFCFSHGRLLGAEWHHLHFDQGESFYGHILDRKNHPRARKAIPLLDKVAHIGESNMRLVPALQMVDLFAWCITHSGTVAREWHKGLNRLPWQSLSLDYDKLMNPKKGALEQVKSWKLPRRKRTK
jgi:hypothetical protein